MKAKNEQFIIDYCASKGEIITNKNLIDWAIDGTEKESDLLEYANDYLSECHSVRCENKNAWRYEV